MTMTGPLNGFPVFRGLQKPLEFLGIRGRFMVFAAATAGSTILWYFLAAWLFGPGVAGGMSIAILGAGLVTIYTKQKQGLHNKKRFNGTVVYSNIFRNHL